MSKIIYGIAVILLLVLGVLGYFFFYKPYEQNLAYQQSSQLFANKEKCAADGAAWKKDNPYPFGSQIDEYAYAPDLSTCLIYETDIGLSQTSSGFSFPDGASNKIIYDLYANNLIASCNTNDKGIEDSTSSCTLLYSYVSKYFSAQENETSKYEKSM